MYDLQVEEGTPFGRWYTLGEGPMPREEEAVEMFRAASEVLGSAGYEHYEAREPSPLSCTSSVDA